MNIKDAIVLAENGFRMRNKNGTGNILKISHASVVMTNENGDQLVPSYDGWDFEDENLREKSRINREAI